MHRSTVSALLLAAAGVMMVLIPTLGQVFNYAAGAFLILAGALGIRS